jgi:hypothetical protein
MAMAMADTPNSLTPMAEALSAEQIPGRLAEIRDQLKLLADYL